MNPLWALGFWIPTNLPSRIPEKGWEDTENDAKYTTRKVQPASIRHMEQFYAPLEIFLFATMLIAEHVRLYPLTLVLKV